MIKCELTIIVIAHNEGKIADYTMKSLLEAAKKLDANKIEHEFLINIDKGDKRTIGFFEEKYRSERIRINYTNFGDPGLARNAATKEANGKFIAMIDADDAVSSNWLMLAIMELKNNPKCVLAHPEIEIRYSNDKIVSIDRRVDLPTRWEDRLALILGNRWCSAVMGRKEIFRKSSYSETKNGFGYEDYFFNCDALNNGVGNIVIKNTSVFCLMKKKSITEESHKNNLVLPYTDLFNLEELQKMAIKNSLKFYPTEPKMDLIPKFIKKHVDDFCEINENFNNVSREIMKRTVELNSAHGCVNIGSMFCQMISEFKARHLSGRVIFVNNLVDYMESIIRRGDAVVVMTNCENLPNKNTINFGRFFGNATEWMKDEIVTRIIVQLGTKEFVVSNSDDLQRWIKKHRLFLDENKIKVSYMI